MKIKEEEKKLWLELYDVAKNIESLEPWKYFSDMDLFAYLSDTYKDIFYCCVMGNAGMHKALAIYKGKQIHGYMDLLDNKYPSYLLTNYQECLTCNYLSRNDTLPKNREIIKELGLHFRGTWISFENFEKGYEPSFINIEQVKMTIEMLKNFFMMFIAILDKGLKVNFEKGEVLLRYYDKKTKLYLNTPAPLMMPEKKFLSVEISNDLKKYISKFPQRDIELEYEFLNHLPIRILENKEKDGRYSYPILRCIADKKTGIILSQEIINMHDFKDKEEYLGNSLDKLINFFEKIGRPKCIYVRDEESMMVLEDLLDKAKIEIEITSRLDTIDEVVEAMLEHM